MSAQVLELFLLGVGTVLRLEKDAPSRHSRDARVYGHTTTAMLKLSTPPPPFVSAGERDARIRAPMSGANPSFGGAMVLTSDCSGTRLDNCTLSGNAAVNGVGGDLAVLAAPSGK